MPPLALSDEQRACVDPFVRGKNCVVAACCGAGKTRVLIGAALAEPEDSRSLILSFNRALADETRIKVEEHAERIEVQNIHRMATEVYGTTVPDNRTLQAMLDDPDAEMDPDGTHSDYTLIAIDEIQDVFGIHIQFIVRLLQHQRVFPSLLLVGDDAQTLYEFMHQGQRSLFVNYRSLTPPGARWRKMALTKTQRLTPEITEFVNRFFREPHHPPLVSAKPWGTAPRPRVVFGREHDLIRTLSGMLERHGPGNVMVTCYTLKSPFVAVVEAYLVQLGVPTHNTMYSRDEDPSGKVLLATYHRAKGLERHAVLCIGLTAHYWCLNDRPVGPDGAPVVTPPGHVAVTRAMHELVMFSHGFHGMYPTIPDFDTLRQYADIEDLEYVKPLSKVIEGSDKWKAKCNSNDKEMVFDRFAQWLPDNTMAKITAGISFDSELDGWWGGDGGGDFFNEPDADVNEIELIQDFGDDVIATALNIWLSEFQCREVETLHNAVRKGHGARNKYEHAYWASQKRRVWYPWNSAKTSNAAFLAALMHQGTHAVQVGGVGTEMSRFSELDQRDRAGYFRGFQELCTRVRSELRGAVYNTMIELDDDRVGVVDIVHDDCAVAFTTSDENHLTEEVIRKIWWNAIFHGNTRVYYLNSYISREYAVDADTLEQAQY